MRVLVGCEYSGAVRDAFLALGHDAMSCDLLPTDAPGPHYQGDVRDVIADRWDLAVFHPECTYLCNSGVRWLSTDITRWPKMIAGAVFFRELLNADIPRIAVENPVMHKHAAAIIGRRQDQVVQPWMFGHPEKKATGLWLKGLPPLVATDDVRDVMAGLPKSQTDRIHYASPGPDRWRAAVDHLRWHCRGDGRAVGRRRASRGGRVITPTVLLANLRATTQADAARALAEAIRRTP